MKEATSNALATWANAITAGRLVLSGLLADQVPRVMAAFPGWRLTGERAEEAWRTLRLEREA